MKTWMIPALLLLLCGCDDQGLPPDDSLKPAVSVQFLEASCTEAWLRLTPRNVSPPFTVTLLRNDSAVATLSSPAADTTVIDEGLSPSRTYTYRARLTSPSGLNLTGDPVQSRTLDTTSHQFTWETTVLGDGGSSIFYDVAIVNDTLAYAVGEVYLRDSSGVLEILPHNLAKWDGRAWRMERVTVSTSGGPVTVPLRGICAFSEREIWLSSGIPVQKTTTGWRQYHLFDMGVLLQTDGPVWHVWGSSSSNLYFAGDRGTIAHFDGITWRRVESGTTDYINDISGVFAAPLGGDQAYCAVSTYAQPGDRKILRLSGGLQADSLPWSPGTTLGSVWGNAHRLLFACGDWVHARLGSSWREVQTPVLGFKLRIRGTGYNNIFIAGLGSSAHHNGSTWQRLDHTNGVDMTSVHCRKELVILVGTSQSGRGYLTVGRRR